MRIAVLILLLLLSMLPQGGLAETYVQTTLDPKSGDSKTLFRLEVQISSDLLDEVHAPVFKESKEFLIEARGQKRAVRIVNGDPSQTLSFLYQVTPSSQLSPGQYQLPEGTIRVAGQTYTVGNNTVLIEATPTAQRKGPVDFVQMVPNLSPFEGEQLTYRAELLTSTDVSDAVIEEIALDDFFREEFPEQKQVVRRVSNSRVISIREALYPSHPGEARIPSRALTAKIRERRQTRSLLGSAFDEFEELIESWDYKPARFTAPELKLNVRPLPPKPSGVSGYIPVGKTEISLSLDKTELQAGETALLELTVESEGNLKPFDINLAKFLQLPNLKIYPEKPEIDKNLVNDRVIFRKIFRAAIVPEYGGAYELPAPKVTFFDPKEEIYKQSSSDGASLVVGGPKAPEREPASEEPETVTEEPSVPPTAEFREFATPPWLATHIGISQRAFLLFLLIPVIALPAYGLIKSSSKASREKTFAEVLAGLRANNWNFEEGDLELLHQSATREGITDISQLESLMNRVQYAPNAARAEAEGALKAYLQEYRQ